MNGRKRRWLRHAAQLLALPTAPLCEEAVARWIEAFVARRPALHLAADRWGNLLIRYAGSRTRRPALVFAAHMDHPGFRAVAMQPDGLLKCRWMGAVPEHLFPNAKVRFFSCGEWVRGVVQFLAPGRKGRATRDVVVAVRSPVGPGSPGMWDFPDPRIVGTRLFARGCDDAAGVASLVALLDEACRLRLRNGFHVLLTRAEESGFLGAIGACRARTLPEGSVVVTVEASQALPGAAHGNGPIIRVGDRVSIFSPNVTRALVEVARDLQRRRPDFRCQRKLMDGGMCESSIYMEYGYPAGGLSLPLGNYHNIGPCARRLRAEFIDVRDYENLIRLHVAIAQGFRSNRRDGRKSLKRYERLFLRNRPLLRHPRRGR